MATQNVCVKNVHNNATLTLPDVPLAQNVGDLKAQIAADPRFPPAEDQAILLDGRDLNDDVLVSFIPPVMSMLWIVNRGEAQRRRRAQADANAVGAAPAPDAEADAMDAAVDAGAGAGVDAGVGVDAGAGVDAAPPAVPEVDVDADAAAAAPGAGGGGAAPVPPEIAGRSLQLFFEMFGRSLWLEVPLHATFGHIKARYLSEQLGIPPRSLRLIYVGAELNDLSSPFQVRPSRRRFGRAGWVAGCGT